MHLEKGKGLSIVVGRGLNTGNAQEKERIPVAAPSPRYTIFTEFNSPFTSTPEGGGYSLLCPIQWDVPMDRVWFLSFLSGDPNREYNLVRVRRVPPNVKQDIACTIELICLMEFICAPCLYKQ